MRASGDLRRIEDADGLVSYASPRLAALGVPHLFTTRRGGGRALDPADATDRERIARAAGRPEAVLVTVRQVHGAAVLEVGSTRPAAGAEADALVSSRSDLLVGVHVADCVPVLLAREDGRRVAAVHAGWRGIVAGVVPRALETLGDGAHVAAIGPCLSRAHFEVGPEVEEAFRSVGLGAVIETRADARARIDLRAAVRCQLEAAGVRAIDTSDRCTYAHEAEFYSYRRDVTHGGQARTGRLAAVIAAR